MIYWIHCASVSITKQNLYLENWREERKLYPYALANQKLLGSYMKSQGFVYGYRIIWPNTTFKQWS